METGGGGRWPLTQEERKSLPPPGTPTQPSSCLGLDWGGGHAWSSFLLAPDEGREDAEPDGPPSARGLPGPLRGDDLPLSRTGSRVSRRLLPTTTYAAAEIPGASTGDGASVVGCVSLARHPQDKGQAVSLPLCGSCFPGHWPVGGAMQPVSPIPTNSGVMGFPGSPGKVSRCRASPARGGSWDRWGGGSFPAMVGIPPGVSSTHTHRQPGPPVQPTANRELSCRQILFSTTTPLLKQRVINSAKLLFRVVFATGLEIIVALENYVLFDFPSPPSSAKA